MFAANNRTKLWLVSLGILISFFVARQVYSSFSGNLTQFWQAVVRLGGQADPQLKSQLEKVLALAEKAPEKEKLTLINDFVADTIVYASDIKAWKEKDYWASPAETMAKRLGDCEDFAISKYVFLKKLGVEEQKLRLIYVKAKIGGSRSRVTQAHMVLGYYATPTSQPLILDSLVSEILPAAQRTDLIPVFSFNSNGLWSPGAKNSSDSPTARLSRWRNVLQKLTTEGLS